MLYKYLSPERIDVIHDKKIRYSQSCALNDPFEASFLISDKAAENKIINALYESATEFWNSLKETEKTKENEEILRGKIKEETDRINMMLSANKFGEEVEKLVQKRIGILSLSKTSNSLLMWAHYAKSYTGYVIGFDESDKYFIEPDKNGNLVYPKNVTYTSERLVIDAKDSLFYEKLFCTKPIEWSYEQEVRVIRDFPKSVGIKKDNNGYPIFFSRFPERIVKEIIVGHKCTITSEIMKIIAKYDHKIPLYRMKIDNNKYILNKEIIQEES